MRLRLATFNVENLFTRFDFSAFADPYSQRYLPPIVQFYGAYGDGDLKKFEDFKRHVETAAISQDDDKRQHTALAFAEADADIYGLQEVDNIHALTRFMNAYVKKIGVDQYNQLVLQEGNDRRGIDVAAIARDIRPVMSRSHVHITGAWVDDEDTGKQLLNDYPLAKEKQKELKSMRVFRRDCLELETKLKDKIVTIFVCHFKSMSGGRKKTIGMRQLEAITVRELINRKFDDPADALWIVMGDLNDYRLQIKVSSKAGDDGSFPETIKELNDNAPSGIDPLIKDGFGFNTLEKLPQDERWTHYYPSDRSKTQLDYIIASPAMKTRMSSISNNPKIIRNGMPFRVPNTDDLNRYPRIGWDRPKASDHCPLVVQFDVR
jgi:endonuclease/exonuclease/phosphatase family metal-dependent hydrolase